MTKDQQAVIDAFHRVAAQWAVGGDRRAQRVIENLTPAVIREIESAAPKPKRAPRSAAATTPRSKR